MIGLLAPGCLAVVIVAVTGRMRMRVPGISAAERAAAGWLLYRASARYEALRGGDQRRRGPPAWRVSLSEERASERRRGGGRPLVDVAMTVSAAAALLVLTIWFFFYAELRLSPFP